MKLIEIANKIDKSRKNELCADITCMAQELNVNLDWADQKRLIGYWIKNWCDIDTWFVFYIFYKRY
jgi:hypothetical protein